MARLVSVVMPVLDAGPWLGEAIDSILTQSHEDLELIVVDDGSSDDSRDIASAAAARDERVRTLFLERDPPLTSSSRAANAGNALARGAYIARMDADDVARPRRIERQIAFLEERGLDVCGGLAQGFGTGNGRFLYAETPEGVERELIFRVGLLHPTMLARAELMRRHPFVEAATHEDYEWQVRVAAAGARIGNLQEILLDRRLHPAQANLRHAILFMRDLRQYRFRHVLRLFPRLGPDDYQILASLAEKWVPAGTAELERAGDWLVRLADSPDRTLRPLMARRWEQACDRAGLAPDDSLRRRFAATLDPDGGA
jgi:glycosyltransferase involved in cell wall biosynthesis